MRVMPVTPELLKILENARTDSRSLISECEAEIDNYTGNSRKIVLAEIEIRKQRLAIINDLLERYDE